MSTYFVTGNLRHNGQRYAAGETIELSETEAQALSHVLQTEPVSATEAPESVETPTEPLPEVTVGGERSESGEPSFDGTQEAIRTEAEDVTPVVSEPGAPTQAETTAKKGTVGRGKSKEKPAETADATPPVVDPSKDL